MTAAQPNNFSDYQRDVAGPAYDAEAVTPDDVAEFTVVARALYIGGTGDVTLRTLAGNTVLFTAVPAGTILPVVCRGVDDTGTDATNIVALY